VAERDGGGPDDPVEVGGHATALHLPRHGDLEREAAEPRVDRVQSLGRPHHGRRRAGERGGGEREGRRGRGDDGRPSHRTDLHTPSRSRVTSEPPQEPNVTSPRLLAAALLVALAVPAGAFAAHGARTADPSLTLNVNLGGALEVVLGNGTRIRSA